MHVIFDDTPDGEKYRKRVMQVRPLPVLPKTDLTNKTTHEIFEPVKNQWQMLKKRIQKAASRPGAKSKLAKFLKIDLSQLSKYLSDAKKSAREPGADYTLQMLQWVEQQERKT